MKVATLEILRNGERRSFDRMSVGRVSTLRGGDSRPVDIVVQDFSAEGFSFKSSEHFEIGDVVRVGLSGAGAADGRIVRRERNDFGCTFVEPLSPKRFAEAFTHQNTIELGAAPLPGPASGEAYPEPVIVKWPGSVRLAILVVVPISLWAGIVGSVLAILR